jgi:hypothetical protein
MNPLETANVQPRYATGAEEDVSGRARHEKEAAEPLPAPELEDPAPPPVNPYAPTGWKHKERLEFDVRVPSGQLVKVLRLEREDLFRLNLIQYLDTFTPLLMEDTISDEERERRLKETMAEKPDSLMNMFVAIDQVVMAAAIKPRVTTDEKLVDYGKPKDWDNPRFTPVAYLEDIAMEDRMAIFGAAFGRSMDELKSVREAAASVGSMAEQPSVPQATE